MESFQSAYKKGRNFFIAYLFASLENNDNQHSDVDV